MLHMLMMIACEAGVLARYLHLKEDEAGSSERWGRLSEGTQLTSDRAKMPYVAGGVTPEPTV